MFIKPSEAFPSGEDWVSADVRAFHKGQTATVVETVQDIRDNDLELTKWVFVEAAAAYFKLSLSSPMNDDGGDVIQDNIGRRYIKVTSPVPLPFAESGTLANRANFDAQPKGFTYALTDGTELFYYIKKSSASGDWSNAFPWRGANGSDGVQSSNGTVTDIVRLSQAAYEALSPPNPTTFYIIT